METKRVEAFSDGVFSIVATLLVIELRLPDAPSVWHALALVAPKLLAFVLSFAVVAMYWVAHHSMFHFISRVDRGLLWLNNLTLLCVAFLPFPTAVLGGHPRDAAAITLYGLALILVNGTSTVTWCYATLTKRLAVEHLTTSAARRIAWLHVTPIGAYVVAVSVAAFLPWLSLGIFVAVPAFFIIPNRWLREAMMGGGA